jgi:hypothetical protein
MLPQLKTLNQYKLCSNKHQTHPQIIRFSTLRAFLIWNHFGRLMKAADWATRIIYTIKVGQNNLRRIFPML